MKRRWPYRLAQLSPFVVLALIVAGWLVVPAQARMVASQSSFFSSSVTSDPFVDRWQGVEVDVLQAIDGSIHPGQNVSMDDMSGFKALSDSLAISLQSESASFFDSEGNVIPEALPGTHPVFERLREYEQSTGGQVSVYLLPANPTPPVALSAIADMSVLTEAERSELESSGTVQVLRERVRLSGGDGTSVDYSQLNAGSGSEFAGRYIVWGLNAIGGHVYEMYGVSRPDRSVAMELPYATEWMELDTAANRKMLDSAARRAEGAVFIVGPIDAAPVLLRPSEGARREALVPLVQAKIGRILSWVAPFGLTPEMSRAADGAKWGTAAVSGSASLERTNPPSVAVMLVGSFDTNPAVHVLWKSIGDTPLRRAQVFFAMHFATIEGALGALMLVALVIAPVSLVAERRGFEQLDIERERERVQREARVRVIDRLTRLSDDMDRSAASAGGKVAREVAGVSDDIQATVTELKSILGEVSPKNGDRHE